MKKDPGVLLKHILESAEYIERYVGEISKKEFLKSVQIQDSVIRRLEIIGEAIRNLPEKLKKKYPSVSWREIADMRNVLIHEYFSVDENLLWNAAKKDIPALKKNIIDIIKNLPPKLNWQSSRFVSGRLSVRFRRVARFI